MLGVKNKIFKNGRDDFKRSLKMLEIKKIKITKLHVLKTYVNYYIFVNDTSTRGSIMKYDTYFA